MSSSGIEGVSGSVGTYKCLQCGAAFTMPEDTMALFAGWVPQRCQTCLPGYPPVRPAIEVSQILDRVTSGPDTGVFTCGFCEPNPGPGGWAVVRVVDGAVVSERSASDPATTNNRMAFTAVIAALKLVGPNEMATIYSASQLCVNTIKVWAPDWRRHGWRRPNIANLDLVREALELYESRPNANITWLRDSSNARWHAYADSLSRWHVYDSFENRDLAIAG